MPHPKTFTDSSGKVWDTRQFDDTRSWSMPKKKPPVKKKAIPNLLGKT